MEPMVIMLMEKDSDTGLLSEEIGSYRIRENGELISGIYLLHTEGQDIIHLKLTTDKDVEDWEFSAIYDYYDEEALKDVILSIEELEGYNPMWEITFPFVDSQEGMENLLQEIINKHKVELESVYEAIKDKKQDYEENLGE